VDIPASAWSAREVPDFLQVRFAVVDGEGREKAAGRDLSLLQQTLTAEQDSRAFEQARRKWEKSDLTAWDFGEIPESIDLHANGSFKGCAWPALTPGDGCVHLRLYKTREEADCVHREGIAALYGLYFTRELKELKKALKLTEPLKTWAESFIGVRNMESLLLEKVKKISLPWMSDSGGFRGPCPEDNGEDIDLRTGGIRTVEPLLKAWFEIAGDFRNLEIANRGKRGAGIHSSTSTGNGGTAAGGFSVPLRCGAAFAYPPLSEGPEDTRRTGPAQS
jgi:ATP-dependent helicase HrpA